MMTISSRTVIAALVVSLGIAAFGPGTARAQTIPGVYPRNYTLNCNGTACTAFSGSTCTSSGPVSLTGRLQLATPTAGTGSVAINANFGSIIQTSAINPFSVRIINGTATQQSVGGNKIPVGCFVAIFNVPGAVFLNNTFGCYEATEHDFDLTSQQLNAGTVSCHAKEM
jgi:hypothetical protein